MTGHIDSQILPLLLEGKLDAEDERELARHLSEECEVCEQFLMTVPEEQMEILYRVILRANQTPPVSKATLIGQNPRTVFLRRAWLPLAAALACVVVVFAVRHIIFESKPAETAGIKGPLESPSTSIALALGVWDDSEQGVDAIKALAPQAIVKRQQKLLFRVSVTGRCELGILRSSEHGDVEFLLPAPGRQTFRLDSGLHIVSQGDVPLGLALENLSGRQRFFAFCYTSSLSIVSDILSVVAQGSDHSELPAVVSMAEIFVEDDSP